MNWTTIEGNWRQLAGRIRERWGKLTGDEIDEIAGRKDQLLGRLQERYGIAREEAEEEIDAFVHDCEIDFGAGGRRAG